MDADQASHPLRIDQDLCACGSGLRAVRCCAADLTARPDPAQYELLAPVMARVLQAKDEGKNREAARLLLKILDLAPLWPDALKNLFDLRLAAGAQKAALALAARLATLQPEDAMALGRYAGLLAAREMYEQAIEVARQGLLLAPQMPLFHQLLGMSYTELGQLQAGEAHYRQFLALPPNGQDESQNQIKVNLAWTLRLQGRLDEAAEMYEALCAQGHAGIRALTSFAQVEAGRGHLDKAMDVLREALARAPDDRLAALLSAMLHIRQGEPAAALSRMAVTEAALAPQKLTVTESVVRGRALEQLGHYEQAWAAYQAGRDAQRRHRQGEYDPAPDQARLAALKATFRVDRLTALPRPAPQPHQPQPIFLLGAPRSGTALLEHLLSQSRLIDPADQQAPLPALARLLPAMVQGLGGPELPFPEALSATICGPAREVPALLARFYTERLMQAGVTTKAAKFVTDRHAELPWLLGLGVSLFPQAPVIHLLRHPFDAVLSAFTQDRLYQGDAGITLVSLAQLYDMQMQAIAHIRGQMTMRCLCVRYEDLVTAPAATLRQIHKFIGLEKTNPATLVAAPPRAVPRVPVYRTHLMPLYRSSLYRHRRFGNALAECLPYLAPWVARLGYASVPDAVRAR